jgi:predicted dehydrogenase
MSETRETAEFIFASKGTPGARARLIRAKKEEWIMASEKEEVDRRGFLKTSTAIGAGLALGVSSCGSGGTKESATVAPTTANTPAPKAQSGAAAPKLDGVPAVVPADEQLEKVNIAFIGCGQQGSVLIESIHKECRGISIKAVCDISPFNLTRTKNLLPYYKHDVKDHAYEDYREMLDREKDLHGVIIATPDWMHAEHAIACMKAGLHVYCEKEMSNDIAKAREMVKVSRETGKLLQIGHQRRSSERYRFAREKLLDGTKDVGNGLLGVLTHAHAQWNRSVATRSSPPLSEKARPPVEILQKYGYGSLEEYMNWRNYRKFGGGAICDLGSHQIDVLGWFIGSQPTRVVVDGGHDYWERHQNMKYEWYDNVRAIYHFPTPKGVVRALYQVLTTTSALGYYESFMGTEGTLTISENAARCRVYAEGYLTPKDKSRHPWDIWVQKNLLTPFIDPTRKDPDDAATSKGGLSKMAGLYIATVPPEQYLLRVSEKSETLHSSHLNNFFNTIRGKEKLNCPGEVGYECAVQVLKVNQVLDAGQDSGKFEESDFKV